MMAVTESLLRAFLAVSLSTSCVMMPLLALAALLRKRYSARWLYAAWLAIAVRLLIPANLPLPAMDINIPVPERMAYWQATDLLPPPGLGDLPSGGMEAPAQETGRWPVPALRILAAVWVAGAVCFLAVQIAGCLRFRRRLRYHRTQPAPECIQGMLEQVGGDMGLAALPGIGINSGVPAPLLMGLLRPTLLLPHADFGNCELGLILRHELVHYRRRDLWYKLVLLVAHAVHWFNPVVALMVRDAGRQVEMSCDDMVMAGVGPSLRAAYGAAILDTLPVRGSRAITTSFGNLKGTTAMRIDNLFDKTRKRRGVVSFCSVVLITAVISGLAGYAPVSAAAELSQPANSSRAPAASAPRLTLVEREFTIAQLQSMDISGVEVIVPTEHISITRGGDTLKFSYYQMSGSEYDFTTVHDGGKTRTYWALLRMAEGRSDDPQRTIHVTLPESYTPKTIIARTTSGDIAVSGCTVDGMGIYTSSQGGNVTLDGCVANFFSTRTNTGDIAVRNQLADSGMLIADTGTVLFQPRDRVGGYHFEFFTKPTNTITVNGQAYAGGEFELNRSAPKTIWVESGYVQRTDKEEVPGEGTATFTIRD